MSGRQYGLLKIEAEMNHKNDGSEVSWNHLRYVCTVPTLQTSCPIEKDEKHNITEKLVSDEPLTLLIEGTSNTKPHSANRAAMITYNNKHVFYEGT